MARKNDKREQPVFYMEDPKQFADQLEEYIKGHNYEDWEPDLAIYKGEARARCAHSAVQRQRRSRERHKEERVAGQTILSREGFGKIPHRCNSSDRQEK